MSDNKPHSLHWRLAQQARPYWPQLSGIFLLSFLSTPFALLSPLPLKIAVDSVLDNHPLPRFLNDWLPSGLTQSPNGLLVLAVALLVGSRTIHECAAATAAFLTATRKIEWEEKCDER